MTDLEDQPSEWQRLEDERDDATSECQGEIAECPDEMEYEAGGASVSVEITIEPRAPLMMEALGEIREAADDQPWNEQIKRCAQHLEEALKTWKTVEG